MSIEQKLIQNLQKIKKNIPMKQGWNEIKDFLMNMADVIRSSSDRTCDFLEFNISYRWGFGAIKRPVYEIGKLIIERFPEGTAEVSEEDIRFMDLLSDIYMALYQNNTIIIHDLDTDTYYNIAPYGHLESHYYHICFQEDNTLSKEEASRIPETSIITVYSVDDVLLIK